MSSSAAPRKQERDFSKEVKALIPQVTELAKNNQLQEAVDKLLVLEKQTRNASDLASTSTILTTIPNLCYKASNYGLLGSSVVLLAKRHGQLKEAVVKMMDEVLGYLPAIKEKEGVEQWLELIKTFRGVTEGKIHLELPRARLTVLLSKHHELLAQTAPPPSTETSTVSATAPKSTTSSSEPEKEKEPVSSKEHLDRAADLLSELQVETYSSMERREKTEFILEQMRLESQRGNWTRVRVGGRKINRAHLKEDGYTDLKLKFYSLIIALALEEDAFLDACKAYQEVYDTDEVKNDEAKAKEALEMVAYFVILAVYDNEQSDMLHKLFHDKKMEKVALQHELLKSFTTRELMRWPGIETLYGPTLRASSVFSANDKKGESRWEVLHNRVIEHNIRVVAEYYTRITIGRLAELLDLPEERTELVLCRLVVAKTVYARIDRLAGVIIFDAKKSGDDVLNEWSGNLEKMLGLIEKTSHLINKEYAVHAAKVISK
ncbi:26S proteasome regulatory complex, subunit RPN5/PSMD12 [Phaffia rhodozyma]|uniref:26S proteasome regulatory complex, subunit RPN5/PSMD12 n=1 Tax=Phaffia rhodozyma TaxID=264483 RepID=A0A0F7SHH5_PHARH|nr:26S proteasome regulatory complex, subunit RPN5/PSMD12 [Phaffia rhodozyma]